MRNADDGGLQNGRHRFLANVYPVWLTNINVNTNRERWRGHWERWPRPSAVRRQATTRGGSLSCRKINNGRCHPKSLAAVGTKILCVQSTTGQMAVLIVVSQPTLLSLFRYQQPRQCNICLAINWLLLAGGAGRDANEHRRLNSCPSFQMALKCEDSMLSAGDLWPVNLTSLQ